MAAATRSVPSTSLVSTFLASILMALLICVPALAGETGVMSFCESNPDNASFNDVDAAYQAYLATMEDNKRLESLVAAGYKSFQKRAGNLRVGKPYIAKHAERLCSMYDVLAQTLEETELRELIK